ncbi:MAG TPA: DNA-binding domain-containing protein [Pyrinomonadaceae bacterium]|jgi:hypothetical protein
MSGGGATEFGLERLQRWVQAVVTHQRGVGAGVASDEARACIRVEPGAVETVVAPSATLSGAQRLAVYSRSYHARLLQCLRETFPALLRALGGELFDLFALGYLERHPPHSYTLDRLADDFARHLAETRPDADAPPAEREAWPDFVVELAALELEFAKVYDGPGLEGRARGSARRAVELFTRDDGRLLEARPARAPSSRLFAFGHPVHAYMLAARAGESPALPRPAQTFVAMTRLDYRVSVYGLDAAQHSFLHALGGGRSVGEALEASGGEGAGARASTARGWLREWADRGFFDIF